MPSELPTDPYRPPPLLAESESVTPAAVAYYRRRPGWFVTICVIAIARGPLALHSLYAIAR
jgi:hypothetical protein